MPLGQIQAKMAEEEGNIIAKSHHKNAVRQVPCCTVPLLMTTNGYHIFNAWLAAAGSW